LATTGEDLGATRALQLLERWPGARALAAATREEITEFRRAQRTATWSAARGRVQALHAADPASPGVSVCLGALGRSHA